MDDLIAYNLVISGTLNNLNDFITAERTSRYKGAKMKAQNENIVSIAIRQCMKGVSINKPVFMEYLWVEPNKRRDLDNISSFGRKVIQDALVNSGILKDDGWKYIVGFSDRFKVDKKNPRIEVVIREVTL
ncbi:MAG: RusA family crossover junction endodeoxyribonuclease [Dorea sp.]|nr:RusA family crossover junction endodeoxyribonuclease [Dorea sp.]